jgi:hypothetical protein
MTAHVDVLDLVSLLKVSEEPFVLATVVRAVSATAAKAGAKAVIEPPRVCRRPQLLRGWGYDGEDVEPLLA